MFLVFVLYMSLKSTHTPKDEKKFGEGMLQDSNAENWWKPGSGGI